VLDRWSRSAGAVSTVVTRSAAERRSRFRREGRASSSVPRSARLIGTTLLYNRPMESDGTDHRHARVAVVVAFAICAAVLVWHAVDYLPFFEDDSFISLRYAKRLLEGRGLTWTDGERVEGYSNFLWVVVVAFAGLPGQDLVATARVLGVTCAVVLLGSFFWVHRRGDPGMGISAGVVGALAVSLSGTVAAHSVAGLEQPLLAVLVVWGLAWTLPLVEGTSPSVREIAIPGVLFGLASLVRPDAPLIVAAVCAALIAVRGFDRDSLRIAASMACVAAAFFVGQLAFRLAYYGDWIPNSARGKVAVTPRRVAEGWRYLVDGVIPVTGLVAGLALGAVAAAHDVRFRRRFGVIAIPIVVWCGYIVCVGGDLVPHHRHLFVAISMAGLATSMTVGYLLTTVVKKRLLAMTLVVALLPLFVALGSLQDPHRTKAKNNRWFWTGKPVGRFLERAFGAQQPLVAVDAAGALPFFSELPSLDMLGLNDRTIAHHPPETLGWGKLAHELGDGAYVLSRRPDLVVFNNSCGSDRPNWLSGKQMLRDPRFFRDYRLIAYEIVDGRRPLTSRIWTRVEGAAGVRRVDGRVQVPGYLLSTGEATPARLDEDGRLHLRVTRQHPGRLRGLVLDPGRWTLRCDATGGDPMVEVRSEPGEVLTRADSPRVFSLVKRSAITIEVSSPRAGPVRLYGIELQRENG